MGAPYLTMLPQWEDCERCSRSKRRVGTLAPAWTDDSVVLLMAAPTRASQAAQTHSPQVTDVALELETRLGLPPETVTVDYLVACGLGKPTPDEVAACSARFLEQLKPKAIVLLGRETQALAREAGLTDGQQWRMVGSPWSLPVDEADDVAAAVVALGGRLSKPPRPAAAGPGRGSLGSAASNLLATLGAHAGRRVLRKRWRKWRTRRYGRLTAAHVHEHLQGRRSYSAFRPRGEWPFVVIDIDRHNAVQAKHFDSTLASVRAHFPSAIEIVSSSSGGRHVYVRLPGNVRYEEAALILRAFFASHELLYRDEGSGRARGPGRERPVRAELLEVPIHPPRLPFGVGSTFPGDVRPIADQVDDFAARLANAAHCDFDNVRAHVFTTVNLHGKWSWRKQRKLERYLALHEVASLPKLSAAHRADPSIERLPRALRRLAVHGVPAYGTRTRWMIELAAAFGRDAAPESSEARLVKWVRSHDHVSEDVEQDVDRVLAEARLLARREHPGGVPERVWLQVRDMVRASYRLSQDPILRAALEKGRRLGDPSRLSLTVLLRTAFEILRMFYRGRRRSRRLHHSYFATFAGSARPRDVEIVLTHIRDDGRGWLRFVQAARAGTSSRVYELMPMAWPDRPGEPLVYRP